MQNCQTPVILGKEIILTGRGTMGYFNERTFQMSTIIFHYGLTPYELAVYGYLVSCSGNRNACQAKIKTIASTCGCSESTARRALHGLQSKGFIDIKGNVQCLKSGGHRQTCNRYYLLDRSEWKVPDSA